MAPCMYYACICCHETCDFDDITMGCKGGGEFLCCVAEDCCAAGEESKGVGMVEKKDGEFCRLALPCCVRALKTPTVLAAGGGSCLCIWEACSFPFSEDFVPEMVCACCFFSCKPNTGFMQPPPYSKALDKPKGGPQAADMNRN